MKRFCLLILGLLAGGALAQPRSQFDSVTVRFRVYPPDARVVLALGGSRPEPVGPKGVAISRQSWESLGGQLPFEVSRPGFRSPSQQKVEYGYLHAPENEVEPGVYLWPPRSQAELILEPQNQLAAVTAWVRFHPVPATVLLAAGGLGFGLFVRSRRRFQAQTQEMRRREELARKAASSTDPLVRDQARLGDFVVVDRLGAGGMATVYLGLPDRALTGTDYVAIKVMQTGLADSEEYAQRFRREWKVLSGLSHPNIVRILDQGDADGRLYIVMDYIRGRTLGAVIGGRRIEAAELATFLHPVLDALIYAHGRGVVHRDLKPDNLMVEDSGRIVVMDFGLARRDDEGKLTATGVAVGTPSYLPPEQLAGAPLDPRSDQYSLGVIAYELLAGRCPFQGSEALAIAMQHMTTPPPPLHSLRPDLSPAVERWVMRMLAKDPSRRFPDMRAVKSALDLVLRDPQAGLDWPLETPARDPSRPVSGPTGSESDAREDTLTSLPADQGEDTAALALKSQMLQRRPPEDSPG